MKVTRKYKKEPEPDVGLHQHFFVKGCMPTQEKLPPLPELSDGEKDKIRVRYHNLKTHLPEMIGFVKELVAEGMMPGLRNVRVMVHKKGTK